MVHCGCCGTEILFPEPKYRSRLEGLNAAIVQVLCKKCFSQSKTLSVVVNFAPTTSFGRHISLNAQTGSAGIEDPTTKTAEVSGT